MADEIIPMGGSPIVCALCGTEFRDGDRFIIEQTAVMKKTSEHGNFYQIVEEIALCTFDCEAEVGESGAEATPNPSPDGTD